jgi:predicted PurR-regulated permease PerM
MSRSVHLHPLAVVLAVVAGTTLGGIAGALIAVPLVAFLNTTIQALRADPDQPLHEPAFPTRENPPSGQPTAKEPSGEGQPANGD